jgi:predicted transcriptional regulator
VRAISVKLPDDLLAELAKTARATRLTKSALVRDCLKKALASGTQASALSCYDLARDLAGKLKGLPGDLAQSAKYMKAFGR